MNNQVSDRYQLEYDEQNQPYYIDSWTGYSYWEIPLEPTKQTYDEDNHIEDYNYNNYEGYYIENKKDDTNENNKEEDDQKNEENDKMGYISMVEEIQEQFQYDWDMLNEYNIPNVVNEEKGRKGLQCLWNDDSVEFILITVFEAKSPLRHYFYYHDVMNKDNLPVYIAHERDIVNELKSEFVPITSFFAFASQVNHTVPFGLFSSTIPTRGKITQIGKEYHRDRSRWRHYQSPNNNVPNNVSFYAYPLKMNGTVEYSIEWSGDRYILTAGMLRSPPTWHRTMTFYAFPAIKYHSLHFHLDNFHLKLDLEDETRLIDFDNQNIRSSSNDSITFHDTVHDIIEGEVIPYKANWNVTFSFYSFRSNVLGSECYYIQKHINNKYENKIGREKNTLDCWIDYSRFYSFDLPILKTTTLRIQYGTKPYNILPADLIEMVYLGSDIHEVSESRIFHQEAWGRWRNKLTFYGFPSSFVCISNNPEDLAPSNLYIYT